MNVKAVVALQGLAKIFKKLPLWGKITAISSLATLCVAIHPVVEEPGRMAYAINGIVERDGVVEYAHHTNFVDKLPDVYINTTDDPKVTDMVILLREKGDDRVYFYRDEPGKRYEDWHQAVWDERKKDQRVSMIISFLISMGLTIGSYPGVIGRLLDLVPKKL